MALKKKVSDITQIPEAQRGLYKQSGNEWVLDIEGGDAPDDAKAKLQEMRANNIELMKKLEGLQSRVGEFEGLDPAQLRAALEKLGQSQSAEEQAAIKAGRFDEVVTSRVGNVKTEYEKRLAAEKKRADELAVKQSDMAGRLARLNGSRQLVGILDEAKLKPRTGALTDLESRYFQAFQPGPDGNIVPTLRPDGSPWTAKEWVDAQVAQASYLFEAGAGGGAPAGTAGGGVRTLINPTPVEFSRNAADIAAGKVVVVRQQ